MRRAVAAVGTGELTPSLRRLRFDVRRAHVVVQAHDAGEDAELAVRVEVVERARDVAVCVERAAHAPRDGPRERAAALVRRVGALRRRVGPARAPRAAASGSAWPPPATCSAERITTCCAGQITNHTLNHMRVPRMPPVRMRVM